MNPEPKTKDYYAIPITCVMGLLRLVQSFNFNPIGGISLFAGNKVQGPLSWLLPLIIMFATDLILIVPLKQKGFDSFSLMTGVVYFSFLIYVFIGKYLMTSGKIANMAMASVLGSSQFFLLTNFAVWAGGDGVNYTRDFSGLLECYIAAIPFFGRSLASDLFYTGALFGIHGLLLKPASKAKVGTES